MGLKGNQKRGNNGKFEANRASKPTRRLASLTPATPRRNTQLDPWGLEYERARETKPASQSEPQPTLNLQDADWLNNDDLRCIMNIIHERHPHLERSDIVLTPTHIALTEIAPGNIDDFVADGAQEDVDTIEDLIHGYETGDDIPPIIAIDHGPDGCTWDTNQRYEILDGYHRATALNELSETETEILIYKP